MWNQTFELPTIKTAMDGQQTFLCEFVDIKRNGWLHYSKALNNLTHNYYRPMLDKMDAQVEELAETMKKNIRSTSM